MASTNTTKLQDVNDNKYGTGLSDGNRLRVINRGVTVVDIGLSDDMACTPMGRVDIQKDSIIIAQADDLVVSKKLMNIGMENGNFYVSDFDFARKSDGTRYTLPKYTVHGEQIDPIVTTRIEVKPGVDLHMHVKITPKDYIDLDFEWEKLPTSAQQTLYMDDIEPPQTLYMDDIDLPAPTGEEADAIVRKAARKAAAPTGGAAAYVARYADLKTKEADDIKQRDNAIVKKELAKKEVICVGNSSDEEEQPKSKRVQPKQQALGGSAKVPHGRPIDPVEEHIQKKVDDAYKTAINAVKVWVMDDRFEGRPPYQCDKTDKNEKPYSGFLLEKFRQEKYAVWKSDNLKLDELYTAIADKHNEKPEVINATMKKLDTNAAAKKRNAENAEIRKKARNLLAQKDKAKITHKTARAKRQKAKEDDRSEPEAGDDESQPLKKAK